jgi:ketosteroid isomerase-like protein
MPSWDEAVDLFEQRRKAWLAEDMDAYLALWDDDMTFQSPVHDEPLVGKPAYEQLVRQSAAFVKPLTFDVMSIAVNGEIVLAEWKISMEWRLQDTTVSYSGMSRARIRNGLITEWREYWNAGDMQLHRPV